MEFLLPEVLVFACTPGREICFSTLADTAEPFADLPAVFCAAIYERILFYLSPGNGHILVNEVRPRGAGPGEARVSHSSPGAPPPQAEMLEFGL